MSLASQVTVTYFWIEFQYTNRLVTIVDIESEYIR